ncbi:hydroxyectoine utilization dehydratase EutB [Bacillus coreaensis]
MSAVLFSKELTIRDVWKAKKNIQGIVQKTPLVFSPVLSEKCGASIYLKCEHLHQTGSFKLRGATNMINSLSSEEKARGVTTFSTGNHGLAVAYAAKQLGIRAVICVSTRVPKAKSEAILKMGAELEIYGDGQDDAEKRCYELHYQEGLTIIPPFDHPLIIGGQGTMALEILEELPDVNGVIGGLSGGGLLSGVGVTMKQSDPSIKIIGVTMEKGAAMHASIASGQPVEVKEFHTLADSLLGGIGVDNQYTFPLVKKYVDDYVLIPESTIAKGMALLYEQHRMIVEGAAAIGVGALIDGLVKPPGDTTVVILSGNNVDLDSHIESIKLHVPIF